MEASIYDFHEKFYIPERNKVAFNFPQIHILGTHNYVKELRKAFNCRGSFQDIVFRHDHAERVVASFSNQIQSKYYSGNISVSIESI